MKNTFILFLVALSFVCSSCNRTPSVEEPDVLKVELKETPVSVSDFFSKVEVIPLETSDSCLLARILRVRGSGDTTYILTQDYPTFRHITLMAFDKKGNYLRSIGRVGQGPGEYSQVYDAVISEQRNRVYMLSPSGSMYTYRLDGSFIDRKILPQKMNFQEIGLTPDGDLLTWSAQNKDDGACIMRLDADSAKLINEFWSDDFWLNWACRDMFYSYQGKAYFAPAFYEEVYELTSDSFRVAYRWDMGEQNINIAQYHFNSNPDTRREEDRRLNEYRETGKIAFNFTNQYQNGKYYYAQLLSLASKPKWKYTNLFYRKKDGAVFYFEKTREGIRIDPEVLTEDFMLCIVPTEELENYKSILPEEEYRVLSKRVEDDNPCVVKFYF